VRRACVERNKSGRANDERPRKSLLLRSSPQPLTSLSRVLTTT
jgi:hypothetical protein